MMYSKLFDLVGCWIMYEVADDKMHELVAYELMSANDVPERDPRDWYVLLEYPITNWGLMHNNRLTSVSVHATRGISLCPNFCFVFYCFHFLFQTSIVKLLWIAVWKRKKQLPSELSLRYFKLLFFFNFVNSIFNYKFPWMSLAFTHYLY